MPINLNKVWDVNCELIRFKKSKVSPVQEDNSHPDTEGMFQYRAEKFTAREHAIYNSSQIIIFESVTSNTFLYKIFS